MKELLEVQEPMRTFRIKRRIWFPENYIVCELEPRLDYYKLLDPCSRSILFKKCFYLFCMLLPFRFIEERQTIDRI